MSRATVDLAPFAKSFEDSIPEVARAIADRIWEEIPTYAALTDPVEREEVENAARRNVTAFMRALAEGRDLSKRDIDALGVVGEQRAHQAIPLEDVLRAFRMVGRVLWDHLAVGLTGPTGPGMQAVVELGGTLMRFTDQISSSVVEHYSAAQRGIVRLQEEQRREFLHDLLSGAYASPDTVVQQARGFGYDLSRSHLAVVATRTEPDGSSDPHSDDIQLFRALDSAAERLHSPAQPIVDRRAGQSIGLCALASSAVALQQVGQWLQHDLGEGWRIGLGGPYAGVEGVRRAYLEAREALEIGRVLQPERDVFLFEEYLMYRFLRSDPALADRFVQEVLGSVIEHDRLRRSELIETLDAYFASDGSAKETGQKLFAHPHTVSYRLKQIEKLTGRALADPEDKLQLHLALKALALGAQPPVPDG